MAIEGSWADGTPLLAIPDYARLNRVPVTAVPDDSERAQPPVSIIWIKQ